MLHSKQPMYQTVIRVVFILNLWLESIILSLYYPTGTPGPPRPLLQSPSGRAWVPVEDEPTAGRGRRSPPLGSQPGPPRSACFLRWKSPVHGKLTFKRGGGDDCLRNRADVLRSSWSTVVGGNQATVNRSLLTFWLRAPGHMAARRRQLWETSVFACKTPSQNMDTSSTIVGVKKDRVIKTSMYQYYSTFLF